MFTYNALLEAAQNAGLEPLCTEEKHLQPWPALAFETPVDLDSIENFPALEKEQAVQTGLLIQNLASQKKRGGVYASTDTGRQTSDYQWGLEKFLPIAQSSHEYWFLRGLKKSKEAGQERSFEFCEGRIFRHDPEKVEGMKKMEERLKQLR